jgi:hypothetical protein
VLAHVMGHRDATTTERKYIHLFNRHRTDEQVREAMRSAMALSASLVRFRAAAGGNRVRVVGVRPGLWLDEISLIHRVPPWKLEAGRARPRLLGRLGWRLRATAYRVGLRRLALVRLAESEA